MSYGVRLKQAMDRCGVSRRQLAKALEISEQAVGLVLRGQSNALSANNNAMAAAFLGVRADWLALGTGGMLGPGEDTMALSSEEKDLIIALRVLSPEERQSVKRIVLDKAREHVRALEALLGRGAEETKVVPLKR